jgi:hypothetical protein
LHKPAKRKKSSFLFVEMMRLVPQKATWCWCSSLRCHWPLRRPFRCHGAGRTTWCWTHHCWTLACACSEPLHRRRGGGWCTKWRQFHCLQPPWSFRSRDGHQGVLWGSPYRKSPPIRWYHCFPHWLREVSSLHELRMIVRIGTWHPPFPPPPPPTLHRGPSQLQLLSRT